MKRYRYSRFQFLPFKIPPGFYISISVCLLVFMGIYAKAFLFTYYFALTENIPLSLAEEIAYEIGAIEEIPIALTYVGLFIAWLTLSGTLVASKATLAQNRLSIIQDGIIESNLDFFTLPKTKMLIGSLPKSVLANAYSQQEIIPSQYIHQKKSWIRTASEDNELFLERTEQQCRQVARITSISCPNYKKKRNGSILHNPDSGCWVGINKDGSPVTLKTAIIDELINSLQV